jgi:hypothetical protein
MLIPARSLPSREALIRWRRSKASWPGSATVAAVRPPSACFAARRSGPGQAETSTKEVSAQRTNYQAPARADARRHGDRGPRGLAQGHVRELGDLPSNTRRGAGVNDGHGPGLTRRRDSLTVGADGVELLVR